jgi:ABC-type Fe3+-hydroxamate transport system substrate-binding protein
MKKVLLAAAALIILMLMLSVAACKSSSTAPTTTATAITPGNGEVINSDSIDTVQIVDINAQSTGFPWQLDVVIESTGSVGTLFNPVALNVGDVVSVVTDQDMSTFNANDVVTAKIKYTGDVNIPGGIRLYLYNVAPQMSP